MKIPQYNFDQRKRRVARRYKWQYRWCWLRNRINKWTEWRWAIVTAAWADELDQGRGGIGMIVQVLKNPLPGDACGFKEPCWVLHPSSHKKHLKAVGKTADERYPLFLNQAVVIP